MNFAMTPQTVEWIEQAPVRVSEEVVVAATPAATFATLADHETWPSWFPGLRKARIDGPAAGVGATRTVWVGPVSVREEFVLWEPARRFSFTLTSSTTPGLASMVEDWLLEATGDNQTRVRYTVGLAGSAPRGLLDPALRLGARQIVGAGLKGLAGQHPRL
jgi:uncharacterized protein YndB with AHSA1/START domain